MQSIVLTSSGSFDNLVQRELESRPPEAGEIRVSIHASSLNFHDLSVVLGRLGEKQNLIPLSDGAGVVEDVGESVTEFAVGDHVVSRFCPNWDEGEPNRHKISAEIPGDYVDGFAAQLVTRPTRFFTRMPSGYSFEQAATLPCAAQTAWRTLMEETTLTPGDTVLVQGSGGVAIFALQFAKMAGCEVIATSSSNEKLERLKALGADHLINYREWPEWGKRALEITGGRGVQAIVETGGAQTMAQSLMAVGYGGYIGVIGVLSGRNADLSLVLALHKNVVIKGISVGSKLHLDNMIRALETNGLEPVISHRFELADIAQAFRLQQAHGHFGKICLTH